MGTKAVPPAIFDLVDQDPQTILILASLEPLSSLFDHQPSDPTDWRIGEFSMLKSIVKMSKQKFLALFLVAGAIAMATLSGSAAPIVQFFQGFEVDSVWGDPGTDPNRVPTGNNGIASRTGAFHAEALVGDFTRWGGYNSVFPTNGYSTSVDVYLNVSGGYANDTKFDWSSAINNPGGTHRRDFVITGGFYSAASGCGPTVNRFVFSASNNTPGNPCSLPLSPIVVTTSGWYSMVHTFLRGAGNVLVVKMELINSSGVEVGTWYRSDASDVIGTTVGGNRYGWLVNSGFPFLAVDNTQRADLDVSSSTEVINHADINNWLFYNDGAPAVPGPASPEGPDPTCGSFVSGPGTTPLGTGSAQVTVSGERRCSLATFQFSGTPLAAIDTLAYSTYNPSAGNGGSPTRSGYLQFNVDFNGTDTWQRRLLYLPNDNGTVIQNNWQEWDTINGGAALWRYSGGTWPAGIGEPGTTPGTTPKSWNTILTTYPGVRMRVTDSFLGIRVGEPYTDGYTENIDAFKFGTTAELQIFDFEPATSQTVTPAAIPTALDNDYTRINNAVQAAPAGSTIILSGTFNWAESNAALSWSRGSDGLTGTTATNNDDYSILAPPNRNGITITAPSVGGATIQGPGDLAAENLEGVFVYSGGDNQNTTISNLRILDFDLSIGMFFGAGGTDAFNGVQILNNYILVARDLNTTVAPADVNQNIGIHYSFGDNILISGNTIDIHGDGVSDSANLRYSTEVGMQSNTSGSAYEGLQITNNTIRVLNAQNADPQTVLGIWENGHGHTKNITVSGNTFTNLAGGNNPATNLQRGFRITSHSSASSVVNYTNNSVSGANIGFQWLAGQTFGGPLLLPVRLTSNTIINNATGVLVDSSGSANLKFNRIVGNSTAGVNNSTGGTVDAENNWWGCNGGPGAAFAGCSGTPNGTLGTVDSTPWLVLTTSASPNVIGLGDVSTVTSFLNTNSNSTPTGPGFVPNGVPVAFVGSLGTVSPTGATTSGGAAGTTFFTANAFGSGGTTTQVDQQIVNAPITVTASCVNVSIAAETSLTGASKTIPVTVGDLTGRGAISADFVVTYNPSVINSPVVSLTALTAGSTLTVNEPAVGTLVISVFQNQPFVGSGAFVNLTYNVIGLPGTVSNLNFTNFAFNEGSPCDTTSNGTLTVLSGTITGTVTYGNPVGTPNPPRHIPDVTLNAVGSVNVSTTTGPSVSNGQYTLSGMGSGSYTVTPSKIGGVTPFFGNSITSNDSALIAQHVVGLASPALTAAQQAAADVSGTGGITSFDAALIARWVAILPGSGNTGSWVFTPANRGYANVNTDQIDQDYSAILMGDVTGNYDQMLSPPRPAQEDDKNAVVASAPTLSAHSGTVVSVPLSVGDTTGHGIRSYQFELRFDPEVLEPLDEPVDFTGSLSEGYSAVVNPNEPGVLRVVVYGTQALTGSGSLLSLRFNTIGAVDSTSTLEWGHFLFNEGGIPFRTSDGLLRVAAAQDGVINGRVQSPNGSALGRTRVTATDTLGNRRSALTSSFGYFQLAGLDLGETYTVTVDSRRYRFAVQTVSLVSSAADIQLIAQE